MSLSSLIEDPNPDDPLRPEVGMQYKTNRPQFNATARDWTKKFAC